MESVNANILERFRRTKRMGNGHLTNTIYRAKDNQRIGRWLCKRRKWQAKNVLATKAKSDFERDYGNNLNTGDIKC